MAKPFKKLADMFGYALIKHAKNYTSFEYYFINATKKFDIQYIIDVGANCGQYALKVRKLGYKGNIVSFEPIRDNYQKILSVAEYDPKWQCYNYALGASEGQGLIHVFRNTDLSSFLEPNKFFGSMFDFSQAGEIIRKENVSIKTLSNLLPSIINNLGQAKLWLKTDTQGYDLEVLKGGAEILPCIDVLQVELAVTPLYEQAPHYIDALSIMREYGFEISGIFPISRNMNNLRIIEFDCVLTRDLRG